MSVGGKCRGGAASLLATLVFCYCAATASAQLRIVTYNTSGAPRTGMNVVLTAIGEELKNGIAKPIDVLLLQEQSRNSGLPDTQAFVTMLNSIYSGTGVTYARGNAIGGGDTTQTIVYRTNTVQLQSEQAFGVLGTSAQPRQTMRFKLRPVGYDDAASFYIYNSHYKASQGTDSGAALSNAERRLVEATAIRDDSDALGNGAHAIYAGDHNFYDFDADEPAFVKLLSAGAGQAVDPINRVGKWSNNSSFADVHTQSPTTSSRYGGQVTGGMDDRFDFQLVTSELVDGEGMSYLSGSYHTFGNNGTTYNDDIDAVGNTYSFSGVTSYTKSQVLGALASVTDHLPVVADYQIPAKMGVQLATVPPIVTMGSSISVGVTISNIASVIAVNGADELDYTLSVSGDLFGGASGIDFALGGGNLHQVTLDTSTAGMKSGVITVSSSSQGAAAAFQTFPINFEVVSLFQPADFDDDGFVDGDDLTTWRTNFGMNGGGTKATGDANLDGMVDGADFLLWQQQFSPVGSTLASTNVPEPAAAVLLLVAGALLASVRTRRP
jgi:hypothetical protein